MKNYEILAVSAGDVFQLVGILLIFVFVLVVTGLTTKWIAGYQQGKTYNRGMRVVETLRLTQNKFIQIVQVGDVYLVVGLGKEEVTMLTTLTKEQFEAYDIQNAVQQTTTGESFKEVLDRLKKNLPKK